MAYEIFIVLGVLLLIGIYVVTVYNKLVKNRVTSDNAWSQIDVQLKRRHDLIPNLVETVKGIMDFEKETLTKVMEARAAAQGAGNIPDRLQAEGEISGLMGKLMAVWENYPNLKANQNAMQLQEELSSTENQIAITRGQYNDVVAKYNTYTEQFPSNIVASIFGFDQKVFFEIPAVEKEAPEVKF